MIWQIQSSSARFVGWTQCNYILLDLICHLARERTEISGVPGSSHSDDKPFLAFMVDKVRTQRLCVIINAGDN